MATYNKPSVAVSGITLMGYEFSGDGIVYEALKAHETAEIKGEESTTLIPFHAIKKYQKSVSASEQTRKDAYCE